MSGVLRRTPDVAVVVTDETVYLGSLPAGPLIVLRGSAAIIWRAAEGAGPEAVARRVAELTGLDVAAVAADADRFVSDLLGRGLLQLDAAEPA